MHLQHFIFTFNALLIVFVVVAAATSILLPDTKGAQAERLGKSPYKVHSQMR